MSSDRLDQQTLFAKKPYKRGYSAPNKLRNIIAAAHVTNLTRSTLTALLDLMGVVAFAAFASATWTLLPLALSLPLSLIFVLACARQLRALECLVHDASHFNWSRTNRRANDISATLFAAIPTGTRISDYRQSHLLHHGKFATRQDPDRQRYAELGLDKLDRSSYGAYWLGIIRLLPKYQIGWFKSFLSNPAYLLFPLLWAAVIFLTIFSRVTDTRFALTSFAAWLLAYGLFLPILRLAGESAEHRYTKADTIFGATISNIGIMHRILFHPHGDGYHTVHHLWPGVPHHSLKALHGRLIKEDQECYGKNVKTRRRMIDDP
ncbi:fatty acid desaturase [Actinokineospora spheciospongiae]|uniref:fatty acid desaturase n=1 Tax=Actinokineospora spheciospongiae TaxID=909613 RepID=UPI000D70ED39|nr:fatty acid desaturase [Actinokineospora spheciospongiae]PWW53670.1 fatty acid desaturase [Actinokineospora spheciospongiae]